ncbi:MAG: ABC transporter ATP-binding protein [Dokdonella sp.]
MKPASERASPQPVLASLDGVHRKFGPVVALNGICLQVRAGELLAVLGRNGAGKSTAINVMLGALGAESGNVEVLGGKPTELAVRQRIGVMLQSTELPDTLKVGELLEQVRGYYPNPRSSADCIALAGLDGLLHRRYGKLSGGQQRRVQFALAICGNPQLLFLDEPTTGLDIDARQGLWKAVRELVAAGSAVLLTTHYLEEAEALADRVAVIADGRVIAEGDIAEIRRRVIQQRIRCITSQSESTIAGWPDVSSACSVDGRIEIMTSKPESIVRRLLAADESLSELEVGRAGLADAFVELTAEEPA